jgi:hypothetical protein
MARKTSLLNMLSKEIRERYPSKEFDYSCMSSSDFDKLFIHVWGAIDRGEGKKRLDASMKFTSEDDDGVVRLSVYYAGENNYAIPYSRHELASVKDYERLWRRIDDFMRGLRR